MNNKGFTLVELLAVIAIMAVIGIVFTVNYTKSIEKANQKECDMFVKELEDAACVYAGLSPARQDSDHRCAITMGECRLTVEFLDSQGLIKSETDACTGGTPSGDVEVYWTNGKKHCEYMGVKTYAQ